MKEGGTNMWNEDSYCANKMWVQLIFSHKFSVGFSCSCKHQMWHLIEMWHSHFGLRLKSSRSDTPCLWLACCCWCVLPSNFIATAICGVSWIGSEELFFQVRGNSSKQKTMLLLLVLLCFVLFSTLTSFMLQFWKYPC